MKLNRVLKHMVTVIKGNNAEISGSKPKNGQQKCATCFATLLQNELNSDVAHFTTHVQTCLQPDLLQDRCNVDGKRRNIAI